MCAVKKDQVGAVAYLRMSTDKQDKSIAEQLSEVRALAQSNGYKILRWKEYADEGESGDDRSRAGFRRLIHDAETIRDFSVVLCWSQDRFSRFDPLEANHYWYLLDRSGVRIVTVCEGVLDFRSMQGWLMASINQVGNSEFLPKLSRNICRGLTAAAKAGKWPTGRPLYGYRRDSDGRLRIFQDEAKLVRWIFETWVYTDTTMHAIARQLNEQGTPSPMGKQWTRRTIRYILTNEHYRGGLVWGKELQGKYNRVVNGVAVQVPDEFRRLDRVPRATQTKDQCIQVEGAWEAIISEDLWLAAQNVKSRRWNKRHPRSDSYILSGIARCAHCGNGLVGRTQRPKNPGGQTYRYYKCSSTCKPFQRDKECRFSISADVLHDIVIGRISANALSPDAIERARKFAEDHWRQVASIGSGSVASLEKKAKRLDQKVSAEEAAIVNTPVDMRAVLFEQIRKLRADRDSVKQQLALARRHASASAEEIKKHIGQTVDAFLSIRHDIESRDPPRVRRAIAELVKEITVSTREFLPGEKRPKHSHAKRTLDDVVIDYRDEHVPDGTFSLLNVPLGICASVIARTSRQKLIPRKSR
jgi:DNA invertase Pin-like site-specific DNA recombinase